MSAETKSAVSPESISVWDHYVDGVLGGAIPACEYIRFACQRHRDDVDRISDSEFPYRFDVERANRVIRFFSRLQLTKGLPAPGKKFVPEPWQQFIIVSLFAWVRKDTHPASPPFDKFKGLRRFRRALIMVPRKNGKSPLLAAIGIYGLIADDEMGAEIYAVATRRDQAKIIWEYATEFRINSGNLAAKIGKQHNSLFIRETNSKFVALCSEEDSIVGLSTHIGLVDEYQEHKTAAVLSRLSAGRSARRQPLVIVIGTAGFNRKSPCWREHENAARVLRGDIADDSYFAFLAEADAEDVKSYRWDREEVWKKSNPNLGVSKSIDYMIEECAAAKNDPSKLNDFLQFDLNIWTQQATSVIPMDKWRKCSTPIPVIVNGQQSMVARGNFEQFLDAMLQQGRYPYAGLDLSEKIDLTALVLLFPPTEFDPLWVIWPRFFVPQENVEQRAKVDQVPYDLWIREGWIHATPGSVVDYDEVREEILRIHNIASIQGLGVDPHNAMQLNTQLSNFGLPVIEVTQGIKSLTDPTKELLAWTQAAKMNHMNNPVLNWNAENLAVSKDAAGGMKPDKAHARERIDGISALVTAMFVALGSDLSSVYTATRGVQFI